jgi:hypothetical protein
MDLSAAIWRKSSHSGGNGGQCVEVAVNLPSMVAVRDSKNPDGPALLFTPSEWQSFIRGMKRRKFQAHLDTRACRRANGLHPTRYGRVQPGWRVTDWGG